MSTFRYARSSGSIILTGRCVHTPYGDDISTAEQQIQAPELKTNQDASLARLTQTYPAVTWSKQENGFIRIRDNRASAAILDAPIHRFELKEAVSLRDALKKLLLAPEIKEYLIRTHTQMPTVFTSSTISNEQSDRRLSQTPAAPKYSHVMTDVTLAEALDNLIQVFPGVWIYSECPGRITITTSPTGAPNFELRRTMSPQPATSSPLAR